MTDDFTNRVLMVVRRIPPGRVASYGEVAAFAGRPRAARAVGNIMRDCHRPDVPCHRVIAAGGRLGGYGGHESLKRALLIAEGVTVVGKRVKAAPAIAGPLGGALAANPSSKAKGAKARGGGKNVRRAAKAGPSRAPARHK